MATLNVKNFPDHLHVRLTDRAKRRRRSLAQEVIHLLTASLAEEPELSVELLKGLGAELWQEGDAAEHVGRERDAWD